MAVNDNEHINGSEQEHGFYIRFSWRAVGRSPVVFKDLAPIPQGAKPSIITLSEGVDDYGSEGCAGPSPVSWPP